MSGLNERYTLVKILVIGPNYKAINLANHSAGNQVTVTQSAFFFCRQIKELRKVYFIQSINISSAS